LLRKSIYASARGFFAFNSEPVLNYFAVGSSAMATTALRAQVAAKWQEAFNRMNKGGSGISGLMMFSQVRLTLSDRPASIS
jgi:hypothetical protein